MKGLVVGLGSIGRRHARNWHLLGLGPLAVCRSTDLPQPEALGVEVVKHRDLQRALDEWQPDVVMVTNPTSLHVATACAAVRAGAHVLVEKPLGHTVDDIPTLLGAASTANRRLAVGYNLRFHPGLARLRAMLHSGAIGKALSARAEVGEYLPDWHPWEDYRRSYSGRHDLGGGAVLTFSHELDALYWLLGAAARVTALAGHVSSLEIDTEDIAEIVVQFRSGAIGSVHVDYVRRAPHRSLEVIGERGVLRWDFHRNRLELYEHASGQWRIEEGDPRFDRNHMFVEELRSFARFVTYGEPGALATGEDGAAVLALGLSALRASAEGRTVELGDPPWKNGQATGD